MGDLVTIIAVRCRIAWATAARPKFTLIVERQAVGYASI